jgi:chromosome segregation ATPase
MFKKISKEVARAAEAVGIIDPSVPAAQEALDGRQQEVIAARKAVEAAEVAYDQAFDAGLESKEIQAREATLAASRTAAERSARALASASRRLDRARSIEAAKIKAAAVKARDEILAARDAIAVEIDEAAERMATLVQEFDAHTGPLADCAAARVCASTPMYGRGMDFAAIALEKLGAIQSRTSDKTAMPNAVKLAALHRGAVVGGFENV